MSVHSSGDGAGWNTALDVDQPHGLDYQEWQDIRIGIRSRMSQEHTTFADSTAGGIHTPGGVAVLGMEITDAAGDPTSTVVADGTYRARGLVWSYTVQAGANKGVLYCNTSAAGVSTAGDFTVLKMHPDLQWAGGDVTWAGIHSFAQDVSIGGALYVDASADISGNVAVTGDLTMSGSLNVGTDVSVSGDMAVDGTADFSTSGFAGDVTFNGAVDGTSAFINATDSYRIIDVQGTNQIVYTKFLTGVMAAGASTSVAHGIADHDKILAVVATFFNSATSRYQVAEMFRTDTAEATVGITVLYDATNILFTNVGTDLDDGNAYRIKIEYMV